MILLELGNEVMIMKKYDYIILGTGPAGYKLAKLLSHTDKSLLAIEGGLFGGTCPNVGCEPKIFLEGAVHTQLMSQALDNRGIIPGKINWEQLMKTKKARFDEWPEQTKKIYYQMCDVVEGYGKFVAPHIVEVNGQQYEGKKIIIATGQHPHKLDIPGSEYTHESSEVLSLEKQPNHAIFFGGGYVGIELATFLAAAGTKVDILVRSERILRLFYGKYAAELVENMEQRNIRIHFFTSPTKILKNSNGFTVKTNNKKLPEIIGDYIVDATGRIPNVNLNLEKAGILYNKHGIDVDSHLETSAKGVYAIGDITNQAVPKLTPVAELQADYLYDVLENGKIERLLYPTIGTAAFSFQQIAQVGVNPQDAKDDSRFSVVEIKIGEGSPYAGINDRKAKLTVVYDKKNRLVGASELSFSAANDINNLVPVIGLKISKEDWHRHVLPIYPALADKVEGILR